MTRRLFGTDGIRGVANIEPMTVEMAMKLGRAAAYIFKRGPGRHQIVIGKDTRLSGYMIENALAAGICSMGVDILLVGPLPTPGISFITSSMRADAGVVISASHNPFQDNGIKFFSPDGYKLPDKVEEKIEELVFSQALDSIRPTATDIGKAYRIDDAKGRYIVFLKNTFPKELSLEGLKIVVDCASGAAYRVAPAVFYELGAKVYPINIHPDGRNINQDCGSTYPQGMCRMVKEKKADLGLALDGDGDRAIFCDHRGNLIDGDQVMAICATRLLKQGKLRQNTLVATVMSNLALEQTVQAAGGRVARTQVGDRYVAEEMARGGYNLGGEQSGHIIFGDFSVTGDGIITALQLLSIMVREDKGLEELSQIMEPYPQILVNVSVDRKEDWSKFTQIGDALREGEKRLSGKGRILLRYSGTEPIARILVEGEDEREIAQIGAQIEQAIKRCLNDEGSPVG